MIVGSERILFPYPYDMMVEELHGAAASRGSSNRYVEELHGAAAQKKHPKMGGIIRAHDPTTTTSALKYLSNFCRHLMLRGTERRPTPLTFTVCIAC
ncbi:hypothetical protein ACFX12_020875 [Malus domestica]